MTFPEKYNSTIRDNHLFTEKDHLLIAVSGGVDSIVLCELCHQAGYNFSIAHCNFQLRGEESERDEQFVRALGKKYQVEVWVKKFDTNGYAEDQKLSIQEAARNLRYTWFSELIKELNKKSVANSDDPLSTSHYRLLTAHHADDNIETLLMNFFRGTGLNGLTGIPASLNYIRRPLLPFSKEEILRFAKENELDHVEDSSNQSSKYTRNFFRNEIIPAISKVYPQVKENLRDNIERFKEMEKLYRSSVDELKRKICRYKNNEVHIPVNLLMKYDNKALIYELIADYGFSDKQVDQLIKLATSESGKYIQSPLGTYRIIKHRHWFIISPVATNEAANIIIEEGERELYFEAGQLSIESISGNNANMLSNSNLVANLDSRNIEFPLLLRKAKTGDYFYPLGMKKKKKLNRFLIDQKLSKTEKEKVWVIETNQRIIWVLGHRIDERFKIIPSTEKMLVLCLSPAK